MDVTRRTVLLSGIGGIVLLSMTNVHQLAKPSKVETQVGGMKYPAIAAHRGGRDMYPEGSMDAYRAIALNHPGMILEVDARPLADGTLVVCHDETVDRIAVGGVTGRVDAMSPAQWRTLRVKNTAGTVTGPAAFLSDVLDEFGGTSAVLMIECKVYTEAARNRFVEQCFPYREQIVSASFSVPTARILGMSGFSGQYLSIVPPASYPSWVEHVAHSHANITPAVVAQAHAAGAKIWAWTVNDTATKNALLAMGVDGIMTDNPNI